MRRKTTRADYLNLASDLRRVANWAARGQKEKLQLIERIFAEARKKGQVWKILKSLKADINPKEAFEDKRKRIFFAEQVLVSSLRLQNQRF